MNRRRDIIVIGGSAGGIVALKPILAALPRTLQASLFIVLHRARQSKQPERLKQVVASMTALPTVSAHDEQPTAPGHVYVCSIDEHMVLQNGLIRLESSPREHLFRPCIDVLFRSAAATYGHRAIAVLLSGTFGNDGTAGLWQIRHRGGVAIVQDPADAEYDGMPLAALRDTDVDYVLPASEIGPVIAALTTGQSDTRTRSRRILIVEDEGVVAANLQQHLAAMGYEVVDWTPRGETALEIARRELPDLVLMDIHLAGALTGIETARRIWQSLQIPVVYCTAHADLDTLRAVQTTESYGYVVKPFQSAAVQAAIELALSRRERELR